MEKIENHIEVLNARKDIQKLKENIQNGLELVQRCGAEVKKRQAKFEKTQKVKKTKTDAKSAKKNKKSPGKKVKFECSDC